MYRAGTLYTRLLTPIAEAQKMNIISQLWELLFYIATSPCVQGDGILQ